MVNTELGAENAYAYENFYGGELGGGFIWKSHIIGKVALNTA